jgi:acetamidase/formamidase
MPHSAPHQLAATRATLRGFFSPTHEPILTINPGERLQYRLSADVSWGVECHTDLITPRRKFEPREGERGGPALCGPVAVRGVDPGMTLELRLLRIVPGDWGWTFVGERLGNRAIMDRLAIGDEAGLRLWTIDREANVATDRTGVRVPIGPFPGTLGLCPGAAHCDGGRHLGWIPRRTGGNMDCRLLTAGATLYLPVEVAGGLLYIGDGHAAQGDGEAGGTAIECPMEAIEIELHAHTWPVEGPVVTGEHGLATLAFADSVEAAAAEALAAMVGLLGRAGLGSRAECLALASAAVDLRITQLVNMGTVGAHAVLRRDVMAANGWDAATMLRAGGALRFARPPG